MKDRLANARASYLAGELTKHQYIETMHDLHAVLFEYSTFMLDTEIKKIEICDKRLVLESSAGVRFECDAVDHRQPPLESLNFGKYESADANMLMRLLVPNSTVFDIGANIGWYSLHIARTIPGARVYSFEPIPYTHERLRRNIELNMCGNVTPYPFGLSNQTGIITFYFYPEGSGGASAANLSGLPSVKEMSCYVRTLDEVRLELNVRVDAIKCDVEGAELFVFQGGLKCLSLDRPLVFCEMLRKWATKFGYHPNEIIALLETLGYECFEVHGNYLQQLTTMNENTAATNFFFLHKDRHSSIIEQLSKDPYECKS